MQYQKFLAILYYLSLCLLTDIAIANDEVNNKKDANINMDSNGIATPPNISIHNSTQTKKIDENTKEVQNNKILENINLGNAVPNSNDEKSQAKNAYVKSDNNILIDISTASIQGLYYPIGSNICRIINHHRNTLHIDCRTLITSGSVKNLELLTKAEVNFAITQADLAISAINGIGIFEKFGPNPNLRLVTTLHEEPLAIITKLDSDIKTLDDIKGKIVNLDGEYNQNIKNIMNVILKAKNWNLNIFKRITNFNIDEQPEALCNNQTDVIIVAAGSPNKIVQKTSRLCEIRIISIEDNDILNAINSDESFIRTVIQGGIYQGVPKDIPTIGARAVLLTTFNTDEDVIYKVTKTIVENISYLQKITKSLNNINVMADSLAMQSIIPLHSSSNKFFTELQQNQGMNQQ